jgi:hypothetical protein
LIANINFFRRVDVDSDRRISFDANDSTQGLHRAARGDYVLAILNTASIHWTPILSTSPNECNWQIAQSRRR